MIIRPNMKKSVFYTIILHNIIHHSLLILLSRQLFYIPSRPFNCLYLYNNKTTILESILKLTNLKWLVLHRNKLTSLKGIEKLTNLEWLDLKGKMNLISDAEKERITALLPDTEIEF